MNKRRDTHTSDSGRLLDGRVHDALVRSCERMLPPALPSVIDHVLATAGASSTRQTPRSAVRGKPDWLVSEVFTAGNWDSYDAVKDPHCRRVVESSDFRQQMRKMRPESGHLMTRRLIVEGKDKVRLPIRRRKRRGRNVEHDFNPTWKYFVRMERNRGADVPAETISVETDVDKTATPGTEQGHDTRLGVQAVDNSDEHASAKDNAVLPADEDDGTLFASVGGETPIQEAPLEGTDIVAPPDGQDMGAISIVLNGYGEKNSQISSVSQVLADQSRHHEAFRSLKSQLEETWDQYHVLRENRDSIRKRYFVPMNRVNLAHLFFHVAQWREYMVAFSSSMALVSREHSVQCVVGLIRSRLKHVRRVRMMWMPTLNLMEE